jgi:hypothetical protein
MTNENEISRLVAAEIEKQKAILLAELSQTLSTVKANLRRDFLADQAMGVGKTNQHYNEPTEAELEPFLAERLRTVGLQEVVQLIAESNGIDEDTYMRQQYEGAMRKEEAKAHAK